MIIINYLINIVYKYRIRCCLVHPVNLEESYSLKILLKKIMSKNYALELTVN